MADDFANWLEDHLYVPILVGIALLVLIVLLVWLLWRKCRNGGRYDYTVLHEDLALPQKMELERKQQQNALRDEVWMNFQFYLRSHPRYATAHQLEDIGSRLDKYWFRVQDVKTKMEKLLSITPYNPKMPIPFNSSNRKVLIDLLKLLQHPYIFPVTDIDFVIEQKLIVLVQPISIRGSLKDYIYQSRCMSCWNEKYCNRSKGLTTRQIQLFGRQILEAVFFLEDKGFPSHGHIHSGNIMMYNGYCRLSAYENAFLGYTSKLNPVVSKRLKDSKDSLDSLSFGHLIFEMCTGYELNTSHPEPSHLTTCQNVEVVKVLNFIFENEENRYPSLREIGKQDFFQVGPLSELEQYNPAPISLSSNMKSLIKLAKKGKPAKKQPSKKKLSVSTDRLSYNRSRASSVGTPPPGAPPQSPPPAPPPPPPGGPPAPAAPPPPPQSQGPSQPPPSSSGRSALLGAIRQGTRLKKAVTNDRSVPKV